MAGVPRALQWSIYGHMALYTAIYGYMDPLPGYLDSLPGYLDPLPGTWYLAPGTGSWVLTAGCYSVGRVGTREVP